MTISVDDYFTSKLAVRKKEPQYIAFINKNSCTSCNSCASMCPVDCIYEVPGPPAQSYHQIDTSRCIGCQMCYRVPSESTGPWQMEICPWNAIDLIYNPNFKDIKEEWATPWEPYFAGQGEAPNFKKLEELGYQLYLNRLVYAKKGGELDGNLQPFLKADWSYGEGAFAILELVEDDGEYVIYRCTEKGDELVDFLYRSYDHMFLD
jgi:ferredoxin